MRHLTLFASLLMLFSFVSQSVFAGTNGSVNRGQSTTINWDVSSETCTGYTTYDDRPDGTVFNSWNGSSKSGNGSNVPIGPFYGPVGAWTFGCEGTPTCTPADSCDSATLTVVDCPVWSPGTTWNSTTKACEAAALPPATASLTISAPGYGTNVHSISYPAGTANTKTWGSTNATSWSDTYRRTGACVNNSWGGSTSWSPWGVALTASGNSNGTGNQSDVGCTVEIGYTATGASNSASDNISIVVDSCLSGNYWYGNPTGCGVCDNGGCAGGGGSPGNPGGTLVCNNGQTPPTCTLPASGSFTNSPSCNITVGNSGCSASITWTSSNVTTVVLTDCGGGVYTSTGSGAQTSSVFVPYNAGCYQLHNGAAGGPVLDTVNASSACGGATVWNGGTGKCEATVLPVNGACSTAHYSCSAGTSANNVSGATDWTWDCTGANGGTTAFGCSEAKPVAVNGSCSTAHYSCSAGTSANNVSGATDWTWDCTGANGGTTAFGCSEAKPVGPVNGVCAGTHYSCAAGTSANNVSGGASWTWSCLGTGGGTDNNACFEVKPAPVVNGSCSASHYNCSSGTSINNNSGATDWTWDCAGSGGGSTDSCSQTKPSGSLSVSPSSCTIPTGNSSCTVNATWNTANPIGTSAITRTNPNGTVYNANNGNNQPITISGAYTSANFYLYNNAIELDSASVSVGCSAGLGKWDTIGGECADPQVVSVVVTGEFYPPGKITFVCSNSDRWQVRKDGNPFASGMYSGATNVTPDTSATYEVICKQGSVSSTPTARYYNSSPPPAPKLSLTASPKTITKNGQTTLSWSGQFPIASCAITAKVVCTNNICSPAQNAYETTMNNLLKNAAEKTDATDPYGALRSLPAAMKTFAPGHTPADSPTDWKALGRRTLLKMEYTTDFTYGCAAGNKETQRIQVTKSNEG